MQVKMYRARSLKEALAKVRHELGPDAAVLETREVTPGWLTSWFTQPQIEVTAARDATVPSRFVARPPRTPSDEGSRPRDQRAEERVADRSDEKSPIIPADTVSYRHQMLQNLTGLNALESLDTGLDPHSASSERRVAALPESLFQLYARLVEAEWPEDVAQELVQQVRSRCNATELRDMNVVQERLIRLIEAMIGTCSPIRVTPGARRIVALVGPTGVGKTTTIAKLAANFRLKEKRQVGLITVDTYRIAAVDQLRTYADIIDLPMEVVSTPRQMREAVQRLSHLDLLLVDTAGRSPRDEVKIQELKSLLNEADADEVHLVLSATTGATGLRKTVDHFAAVGTSALVLTKLDEAMSLGALFPFLRDARLPISYLTDGQNVPDDIHAGDCRKLTRYLLRMDSL